MSGIGKGIIAGLTEWIRRGRINVPDRFKTVAHRGRDRIRDLNKHKRRTSGLRVHNRIDNAIDKISDHVADRARVPVSGGDEAKARLRFAWAIAIKRKKFGYRGLHVIEKVVKAEAAKLEAILSGQ